jgi:hypothetical protein
MFSSEQGPVPRAIEEWPLAVRARLAIGAALAQASAVPLPSPTE